MVGEPSLNKPCGYRIFHPPVMDPFHDARRVLAEAPSPPATIAVDASSSPVNSACQERYEDLKTALKQPRPDFAEADRIYGKCHFSPDEMLAVSREAFEHFFRRGEYESAAGVAVWKKDDKPSMEDKYQRAFTAWYREKLISILIPNLNKLRQTCGIPVMECHNYGNEYCHRLFEARELYVYSAVYFCTSGNSLELGRFNTACNEAYKQTVVQGDVARGKEIADHCKLNLEERKSPCPDAYRSVMTNGKLDVAAQVARYCGWNLNDEKDAIEGLINSITDLDLAIQIATKYNLYRRADLLRKKKAELEAKEAEERRIKEEAEAKRRAAEEAAEAKRRTSEEAKEAKKAEAKAEAEKKIGTLIEKGDLRGAARLAKKLGYNVDEVERLLAAEEEAREAAAAAEREAKKAEREEKEVEDAAKRIEFYSLVERGHLDEAERVRRRSWSQGDVKDMVNEALEKNASPGLLGRERCDRAKRIYQKYEWLGGICVVRDTKLIEKPLEGTCKLECPPKGR